MLLQSNCWNCWKFEVILMNFNFSSSAIENEEIRKVGETETFIGKKVCRIYYVCKTVTWTLCHYNNFVCKTLIKRWSCKKKPTKWHWRIKTDYNFYKESNKAQFIVFVSIRTSFELIKLINAHNDHKYFP